MAKKKPKIILVTKDSNDKQITKEVIEKKGYVKHIEDNGLGYNDFLDKFNSIEKNNGK